MIEKKLHDNWMMRVLGSRGSIPVTVPGSVYYDLLGAGRMEDPYYRDNESKAFEVMENDFEYRTVFDAAEVLECDQVLLRFEGIDTIGDLFLNGVFLGHVENMHRTWEFPVKALLREQGNELRVILRSPVKYVREKDREEHIPGSGEATAGFPYLRKAHCMFGWDWGPRLPDAGIWRDVTLLGFCEARIDSVHIT